MNKKLSLSMPEADIEKLGELSRELGMNRSQYVRYLISGQRKVLPPALKDKRLIEQLAQIDLDMRVLALKEGISPGDALAIYSEIREIKDLLAGRSTSGPMVQK